MVNSVILTLFCQNLKKSIRQIGIGRPKMNSSCPFGMINFVNLFLLFSLFLLLFIGLVALFDTINGSHYTILAIFYLYL